jgi:hypothetical protein
MVAFQVAAWVILPHSEVVAASALACLMCRLVWHLDTVPDAFYFGRACTVEETVAAY